MSHRALRHLRERPHARVLAPRKDFEPPDDDSRRRDHKPMPMMDNRTRFNVPSAALCFGSLADILRGTTAPIQDARNVSLLPSGGGTVLEHDMEHNVGARKGPWSLYELIDETTEEVVAWFAASDEVDALDQIQRILATSPSPYDLDPPPGCRENNDDTRAGRVLVVGRYDWSDEQEEVRGWECEGCWLGLVDRARGQAAVEVWRPTPPDERAALPEGVWLYIPRGEYMFVRLGFADDALSKAVSFLFFTGHTDFSRVTFPGQQTPLSRNICLFDRLQGWMRDGRNLAGAPGLPYYSDFGNSPPESDCLGPYALTEYIFVGQEFELLLSYSNILNSSQRVLYLEPLRPRVFELLNELALAFLERFVLPHASGATFPALGYTIFPDTMEADLSEVANLDKHLLHSFIQGATFRERRLDKVIDYRPAGVRIRQFLALRGPNESPEDLDEGCTEGLFNVLFFILTEAIELAHTRAIDAQGELRLRPDEACYFLPRYFRGAILTDSALFSRLRYSRFFWTGQWTRAWSESSDLE